MVCIGDDKQFILYSELYDNAEEEEVEKKITNSVHPLAWCVGCVSQFLIYLAVPLLAAYRHCVTSFDVCPHIRTFAFIGWIATNELLKRIKCTNAHYREKALHVALNLFIMSE